MNGAVYISFFQGQLESVLEQVVQLAVQEISKTVGSSLNTLLLEAAVKEQENRRLRIRLQGGGGGGGGCSGSGQQKTEPPPQQQLLLPGVPTDIRRLEQRGRVVDQLKGVMEQVLDFAVHELTKIVEASFDDLLLEITKMEREQQDLGETLDRGGGGGAGGRRRGSENDSVSPSGSEDTREEMTEVTRETPRRDGPDRPPVLSVSQDWVPILDKVFGQKWCSDVWQIKELDGGGGGRSLNEGGADQVAPPSTPSVTLEPSPSSPQQDPRWTPLEDMEVFSPDEEAADAQRKTSRSGSGPGPPLSPIGSSGRRSSASMLHRLLTLPSQLLEEEDAAKETMSVLSGDGAGELPDRVGPSPTRGEEEEEEGEEEDKGRKRKRRRTWSECDVCGRRFSRISLLKSHRLTHAVITAASSSPVGSASSSPVGSASSSPVGSAPSALRCSSCGKRFSSSTRLQTHVQNQHPEDQNQHPENRTLNPENLLQSHAQNQHPENRS